MHTKVLHLFRHGLGDAVQFGSVLRHARHYHKDWVNDLACLRGKHSVFTGLVNRTFILEEGQPDRNAYDTVLDNSWDECYHCWPDLPATKTVNYIFTHLNVEPVPALLRYEIPIGQAARERVGVYLAGLPQAPFACLHYQGNTSPDRKDLSHDTVRAVCDFLMGLGLTPVILDWDRRSPLPDNQRIYCPDSHNPLWLGYGTGDAETLAALMDRSSLSICIDSGPQKVAMSLDKPLLAVWTRHHPIHYADLAGGNVLHLVPEGHESLIRGHRETGLDTFNRFYPHVVYRDLTEEIIKQAGLVLSSREAVPPVPQAVNQVAPFVVGIPTLSRYDLLDGLIGSVLASSALPRKVLVIDNGGGYQAKDNRVEVIRPCRNLGVAASWNLMFKLADPLPLVICNDDMKLAPDVLGALVGAEGPVVHAAGQGFGCFRISHDTFRQVGPFDETFFPAYYEDNDYSRRLELAGIPRVDIEHGGIWHPISSTIKAMSSQDRNAFDGQWSRSRAYYQEKWGGLPHFETFKTPFNK